MDLKQHIKQKNKDAFKIAERLHDEYEKYAKEVGWKTQESIQVPFKNLPKENKEVMVKMGKLVLDIFDDYLRNIDEHANYFDREVEGFGIYQLTMIIQQGRYRCSVETFKKEQREHE